MWIRKPEEEILAYLNEHEAKRRSLLRPLLFALALTASILILYQWGCRGGSMRSGVVIVSTPGVFTLETFIAGAFLFAIFFAFFCLPATTQRFVFTVRQRYMSRM
jgi:hypothetical protein